MILVDNQIKDRINNYNKYREFYSDRDAKPLIENFKLENLQSVSYDITITNKIRKFKDTFKKLSLNNKKEIDNSFEEIDISYGYSLRPKEYILVQLNELINMPDDLTAHIRPRTTFTKLGLVLSCQHLNPSYCGKLQLGLYNTTPFVIELTPNLIIGQILFEKLDSEVDKENLYYKKKNAKYQNEEGFVGSKIYDELEDEDKKLVDAEVSKMVESLGFGG